VQVEFLKKLRDEEKYIDLPTLTAAIARDVAVTRAFFDAQSGAGIPLRDGATAATDRIS